MKTIANILWFFFTGLESCVVWYVAGLMWCITIVGIPFGTQCFKMGALCAWPFGKNVDGNFGKHPIANVIWFVFGGFVLALAFAAVGLLWCVTIVGIPFGLQCFKLAKLSLAPFGAKISG